MRRLGVLATSCALLMGGLAGCATDVSDSALAGLPASERTQLRPSTLPSRAVASTAVPQVTPDPAQLQSSSASTAPSASQAASAKPSSATPTPTRAPSPTAKAMLKRGDSGDKVRELQQRLQQLDWYAGKITPDFGAGTEAAVQGFQGKRSLPVTGEVDATTWQALTTMTRQPTRDEMYNVLRPGPPLLKSGDKGDKVRDLQARLKQLDWYAKPVSGLYDAETVAGVKGFQGKRGIPITGAVDQRTQDSLRSMTSTPTSDELTNKPPKKAPSDIDQRCMTGRVLCISKRSNQLRWVVNGQVKQTLDVRFGSELTPTREGVFTLYWKSRDHVSTLYHTAMPYAMFFSGGQAVHYSADFAARGYDGASHGCVNVRDKAGIIWLFDQTREGDKVIVHR